jgi:hypothetical protein
MEWIPILECLSIGTRGGLWLHLVLPGIKWSLFSRTLALRPHALYLGYLESWLPGARVHAQLGCDSKFRLD